MPEKEAIGAENVLQTQDEAATTPQIVAPGMLTVEGATLLAQLLGRVQTLEGRAVGTTAVRVEAKHVGIDVSRQAEIIMIWATETFGADWLTADHGLNMETLRQVRLSLLDAGARLAAIS